MRLACRTYDWSRVLNSDLPKLWGEENCGIYEIAPLRKIDIKEAARQNDIDPEAFIEKLIELEIVPLAIKPITLNFLINKYKKERELPHSKIKIYEYGCEMLCEEHNPAWKDIAYNKNNMSAARKVECTKRIAAVSMLCKKPVISLRSIEEIGDNETTPDEIRGQLQAFSENEIKEALRSGLFSSRGTERFGFAHLSYAEYLAASFITKSNLTKPQIESLLFQSVGGVKIVIPQLQEMAAWLASMHESTFRSIAENDPQVLLRGDLSNKKGAEKELIVKSLLDLLQLQKINNRSWGLRWTYHKLKHANIEKQLDGYIRNKQCNWATRHEAFLIARECGCIGLQDLLVEIAIDTTETQHIREMALGVLEQLGSKEAKAKLLPLLEGEASNDERLMGCILSTVWPENLDAEKLVGILKVPEKEFGGNSYTGFISGDLIKGITPENVAIVLSWLEKNPTKNYYVRRFTDEIIVYAWRQTANESICRSLARLMISLVRTHYRIIDNPNIISENSGIFDDVNARHRLVNCIINEVHNDQVAHYITFYNPKLLRSDDVPWLLENLAGAENKDVRHLWAVFVRYLHDPQNAEHTELLIEYSKQFPMLAKECGFEPIELDSEEAKKFKEYYSDMMERTESGNETTMEEESPISVEEQIAHWLCEAEKGNPDSWLGLCFVIEANKTRGTVIDITSEEAWQRLNESARKQVGQAALQFLEQQPCDTTMWTRKSGWNTHDLAPNKAFYLLKTSFFERFISLDASVWKKWISSLVGCADMPEMKKINAELAQVAYQQCPDEFIAALKLQIEAELRLRQHIEVHKRLITFWDDRISAVILAEIQQNELTSNMYIALLGELLIREYLPAMEYAKSMVSLWPQTDGQAGRIFDAAITLLYKTKDAQWNFILGIMQKDLEFGKQLMLEYAYHSSFMAEGWLTTKLNESQIGDLFIWLLRNFPYAEDPKHVDGSYTPSKRDKVRDLRNMLLNYLTNIGTIGALRALEKVTCEFPKDDWLRSQLVDARKHVIEKTWQAPKPEQLHKLLLSGEARYVTSGQELLETIVEKLGELEIDIRGEYGAMEFLWDNRGNVSSPQWSPKEERNLSDFVVFWLKKTLKAKGVFINRETEIRRGQKNDIHIDAVCNDGSCIDKLSLIIETKGCWHKELLTAMQSQLVDTYLKDNEWPYGIYLVGWFLCDKWEKVDYRKDNTPKKTLEGLKSYLNEQALQIMATTPTVNIKAYVMDLRMA